MNGSKGHKSDTLTGVADTADLVDRFTELVLGGDEPRLLAERTLAILHTLAGAHCSAVFRAGERGLGLFASSGLDQSALDHAALGWKEAADRLRRGEIVVTKGAVPDDPGWRALAPILAGHRIVGLLYLDGNGRDFLGDAGCRRLMKFTAILARALEAPPPPRGVPARGWERDPGAEAANAGPREGLLALLERNEWNIARVARILGVTRRTIYLRLARYGLPREKVRKSLV